MYRPSPKFVLHNVGNIGPNVTYKVRLESKRREELYKFKMPFFKFETNLPKSKIPQNFLSETAALLAKTLEKPQGYCVIQIIPDLPMSWGGSDGPCGIGKILSIGKLGISQNMKYSAVFMDHIEKKLGIPKDKMYIQFVDEEAANMGHNGTTFHEILGMK